MVEKIRIQREVKNIEKKLFSNWQNKCKVKKENKEEKWGKIEKKKESMDETNKQKRCF